MKTKPSAPASTTPSVQTPLDHSKLISLLALAAGAASIPNTSNADIIYTPANTTVSWQGLRSFVINNLPGDSQMGFAAHRTGPTFSSTRFVTAGKRGGGYLQFKRVLLPQSFLWGQTTAPVATHATVASAQSSVHEPNSFGGLYLAFEFKDSSQAGSPMRFGWAGVSLLNGNLSTFNDFPALTINGWAYDDTGAQIPMGATASVPEPSAVALLALGALTLGATGVRSWRRNRTAASRS